MTFMNLLISYRKCSLHTEYSQHLVHIPVWSMLLHLVHPRLFAWTVKTILWSAISI